MNISPGLKAFLWFLGITLLTGSGLLGIVAAFISYGNSMKALNGAKKKSAGSGQNPWMQTHINNEKMQETPAYDVSADFEDDAKCVEFETQQHTAEDTQTAEPTTAAESSRENSGSASSLTETQREAARYLASLSLAKSGLDDEKIRDKIDELEKIIENIYIRLEERPDQSQEARSFMSKTMPLTTGVLESYSEMNIRELKSAEFKKMEKEVNDLLDSTKKAYTKLYDSMYDGDIMDISSEISVLKTLLSQEGLIGSELDLKPSASDIKSSDKEGEVREAAQ